MPVTREEVLWCYRAILGREPESEKTFQEQLRHSNLNSLSKSLLRSEEFNKSNNNFNDLKNWKLDLPKIEIEYEATHPQLEKCLETIKDSWTHMGLTRPHHSVLTNEKFLPGNLSKYIGEFEASGEKESMSIEKILLRHEFDSFSKKICVEYGCGVGRVSLGLARRFNKLHAYDISPSHLNIAKVHAESRGLFNCEFHLCSNDPLAAIENCDFFYSRIVFQHNPPPIIYQLIANSLHSLNPFGIAIFQVPTFSAGYHFSIKEWLSIKHDITDMQMHCLPQSVIYRLIEEQNCELLEVGEDGSAGSNFISNTFIVRKK
jgi:2-polyprenyl-3-methyl-5-hydroxy-6-metoxy-1,4-benzoquinol methylase